MSLPRWEKAPFRNPPTCIPNKSEMFIGTTSIVTKRKFSYNTGISRRAISEINCSRHTQVRISDTGETPKCELMLFLHLNVPRTQFFHNVELGDINLERGNKTNTHLILLYDRCLQNGIRSPFLETLINNVPSVFAQVGKGSLP